MSLHDRIMELPTKDRHMEGWSNTRTAWLAGFDTGLHEAAEVAKSADEIIGSLVAALGDCQDALGASGNCEEVEYARVVLDEYRRWRDAK